MNNGDRKAGHCLLGEDGRLWAIDHGLCLHDEPKLRTVIWDFAGQALPPERVDDVRRLALAPPAELGRAPEPGRGRRPGGAGRGPGAAAVLPRAPVALGLPVAAHLSRRP